MKVTCTGRRVTLKPSFIENAEKRLAKLDKFFPDEAQAQVTVTVEKSGQTVEIMLRSKDLAMRAEKTDERMEDALADAVDLLTRPPQQRKYPLLSRKKAWILCAKSTLP